MGSCLVQQLLNRPAECAHPKDKLTIPAESVRRGKFWHLTLGEVKSTLYQDASLESVSITIKHSVNMCFSANKMVTCHERAIFTSLHEESPLPLIPFYATPFSSSYNSESQTRQVFPSTYHSFVLTSNKSISNPSSTVEEFSCG